VVLGSHSLCVFRRVPPDHLTQQTVLLHRPQVPPPHMLGAGLHQVFAAVQNGKKRIFFRVATFTLFEGECRPVFGPEGLAWWWWWAGPRASAPPRLINSVVERVYSLVACLAPNHNTSARYHLLFVHNGIRYLYICLLICFTICVLMHIWGKKIKTSCMKRVFCLHSAELVPRPQQERKRPQTLVHVLLFNVTFHNIFIRYSQKNVHL